MTLKHSFNEQRSTIINRTPYFNQRKLSASQSPKNDILSLTPLSHSNIMLDRVNHKQNNPSDSIPTSLNTIMEESVNLRASQPYHFVPKNGAPSMKGKMMTRMSTKIRESCSLSKG